ncbi:MAG: GFA family protein [Devosia sp.]
MDRKPRPTVDLSANCACGAVNVTFRGQVRAMFYCTCEDCQKATGSGHAAAIVADPADVMISGETRAFTRHANSSATYTRWFCPSCGTPISGLSSRAPKMLSLPAGLFGAYTDWFEPNQVIFARSHREWDMIDPDLPRYQTYRGEP